MASLPLFPLANPLFPDQVMSLQVFEPRYIKLVSECLKAEQGFGVVQIRDGREVGGVAQIFHFGVEAQIIDFEQLDNGLLGITVQGRRKFTVKSTEVLALNQLQADVAWLDSELEEPVPNEFDGLVLLLAELRQHPAVNALQLPAVGDARHLGWQLCQLLPLGAADKVALLSLHDPIERLYQLAERIRQLGED